MTQQLREALDALAYAHGVELRITRAGDPDHGDDAPLPFAVWGWAPECETYADADIIGAGESESEAIDEARQQIRKWEAGGFE